MKKRVVWILLLYLLAALVPVCAAGTAEGVSPLDAVLFADESSSDTGSSDTGSGGTGSSDTGSGGTGGGSGTGEETWDDDDSVTYSESGYLDMPKLTALEIQRLLDENPTDMPPESQIYESQPSFEYPFYSGRVRAALLQRAADMLSALRRLAGLPEVTLDGGLSEKAQYGAVLLGTADVPFDYSPEQPAGMDNAFYKVATEALGTSNLSAGISLLETPASLMEDSDVDNITTLGHRRFQLYPILEKVGFGYVSGAPNYYGTYTVESVYDYSGTVRDYHFISWPASGYFPADLFSGNTPWSVSLNPKEYAAPVQNEITVIIKSETENKMWYMAGNKIYEPADTGEFLRVDTTGYGVANCIIFRPGDVDYYEGRYNVLITGLKTRKGESAKLAFRVEFFDLSSQGDGITSITTSRFSDTVRNVSVTAYAGRAGRYTLAAAAYDRDGRIIAVNTRTVNLSSERKSYSLMLEPCVNASRVRAYLLDSTGRPASVPREKVLIE